MQFSLILNQFSDKERYAFRNLLQRTVGKIYKYIKRSDVKVIQDSDQYSDVKLPKLKKNKIHNSAWLTFKELFESTIDHPSNLSDIEKLN